MFFISAITSNYFKLGRFPDSNLYIKRACSVMLLEKYWIEVLLPFLITMFSLLLPIVMVSEQTINIIHPPSSLLFEHCTSTRSFIITILDLWQSAPFIKIFNEICDEHHQKYLFAVTKDSFAVTITSSDLAPISLFCTKIQSRILRSATRSVFFDNRPH